VSCSICAVSPALLIHQTHESTTMIKELNELPANVIGFEVTGKVLAQDFLDVVIPAFERVAQVGAFRAVIVIPQFNGMSSGALWEDLRLGVPHLRNWKQIAVVTDIDWIVHVTHLFGWMTPGDVKVFSLSQRAEAIEWVAGR
jgi:hypothetical protein